MPDILALFDAQAMLGNLLVIGAVVIVIVGAALLLRFLAPTSSTTLPSKEAGQTFLRIKNEEEP